MVRLFFLSVMILLLSGCAATIAQEPQPTAPPTVQAHATEPAASPTADATPMATSAAPTATSSADTTASAERAAFADAWQQANQGEAEVTTLLYFGQNVPEGDTRYALWQMPLEEPGQPQKLADMPNTHRFPAPGARLSADEQWIAYAAPISDWPLNLHVMRVDGSNNQILTQTGNPSDCTLKFAWLQGSSTLIYNAGTTGFWAYDATTGSDRLAIPYEQAGELVGVDNRDQVIMAVLRAPELPRDIVAINPLTGPQEVLGPLPRPALDTLFCRKLSPDGRYLLFGMGQSPYQPYLFDSLTGQNRETTIVPNHAFWAQDSQHVLTVSDDPARTIMVHALPDMPVVARAGLPPVGNDGVPSGVRGVSPDGQWLVGCLITDAEHQSWLYHLPSQTWQQLTAGDAHCVNVVGWRTGAAE